MGTPSKTPQSVPYIAHQISESQHWKFHKLSIMIIAILIISFVAYVIIDNSLDRKQIDSLNQSYIDYLNQYDFSAGTEISIDGDNGKAIYQGGEGNTITYGKDNTKSDKEKNS